MEKTGAPRRSVETHHISARTQRDGPERKPCPPQTLPEINIPNGGSILERENSGFSEMVYNNRK